MTVWSALARRAVWRTERFSVGFMISPAWTDAIFWQAERAWSARGEARGGASLTLATSCSSKSVESRPIVSVVTFWREMSSTMPLCSATSPLHRASSLRQHRGLSLPRSAREEPEGRAAHPIRSRRWVALTDSAWALSAGYTGQLLRSPGSVVATCGYTPGRSHRRSPGQGHRSQGAGRCDDSQKGTHLLLLARHGDESLAQLGPAKVLVGLQSENVELGTPPRCSVARGSMMTCDRPVEKFIEMMPTRQAAGRAETPRSSPRMTGLQSSRAGYNSAVMRVAHP